MIDTVTAGEPSIFFTSSKLHLHAMKHRLSGLCVEAYRYVYALLHTNAVSVIIQGQVKVSSEEGEVRLLVKINSQAAGPDAKKMKAVRDLKQLSGQCCLLLCESSLHAALRCTCLECWT